MSQKVRAKFHCESVTHDTYGKLAQLNAVYSENGENKDFAEATPSGSLQIRIDASVPASDFFKPGENYYLDFTKAE